MIRVLLVDDESHVRSAIRKMVDWATLQMDVREADNGEEALLVAAEFKPHLMIVDMQMPLLDGVELMNRLAGGFCEFIVVSGHDDFRYMKGAIAHKAVDYLLKPISRKEINDALTKAVAAIEARTRKDAAGQIVDRLERLLWKEPRLMEPTHIRAIEATDPEGWRNVRLTVVCCTDFAAVASRSRNDDRQLLRYQTEQALQRLAGGDNVYFASGQGGLMEFVIASKAGQDRRSGDAADSGRTTQTPEWLGRRLSEAVGVDAVVFDSLLTDGLPSLRRTYAGFRQAFAERPWAKPASDRGGVKPASDRGGAKAGSAYGGVKPASDRGGVKAQEVDAAGEAAEFRRLCREAGPLVRQGRTAATRDKLGEWIAALQRSPQLSIAQAFSLYTELRSALLDGLDVPASGRTMRPALPHRQLDDFLVFGLHPDSLLASLEQDAEAITAFVRESKPQSGIDAVTGFIRDHYSETYSLDELAARFHFSKSYLCKAFKEKHGCTITDYVTKLRMENARVYMVERGFQVQQASEVVGIHDFSYFSKLYKKHFGYPPSSEAR